MQQLIRTEQCSVRIVAAVGDQTSQEIYRGFSEVVIEREKVVVRFIGPSSHFIDAENPFDTLVMKPFQDNTGSNGVIPGGCFQAGRGSSVSAFSPLWQASGLDYTSAPQWFSDPDGRAGENSRATPSSVETQGQSQLTGAGQSWPEGPGYPRSDIGCAIQR